MSRAALEEPIDGQPGLTESQYKDYVRAGRLFLYRHGVKDLADCEDLLHDSLMKALRGWKPGRGTTFPGFFLHVVLRNEMLNWFRARRAHASQELQEEVHGYSVGFEEALARTRTAKTLSHYREGLSESDRSVLDCAVFLLGSLGTSVTKRGEPHSFAARGAETLGMTRHLFLVAWDRIRADLQRLLREVGRESES